MFPKGQKPHWAQLTGTKASEKLQSSFVSLAGLLSPSFLLQMWCKHSGPSRFIVSCFIGCHPHFYQHPWPPNTNLHCVGHEYVHPHSPILPSSSYHEAAEFHAMGITLTGPHQVFISLSPLHGFTLCRVFLNLLQNHSNAILLILVTVGFPSHSVTVGKRRVRRRTLPAVCVKWAATPSNTGTAWTL